MTFYFIVFLYLFISERRLWGKRNLASGPFFLQGTALYNFERKIQCTFCLPSKGKPRVAHQVHDSLPSTSWHQNNCMGHAFLRPAMKSNARPMSQKNQQVYVSITKWNCHSSANFANCKVQRVCTLELKLRNECGDKILIIVLAVFNVFL